jgi:hypothetical protein
MTPTLTPRERELARHALNFDGTTAKLSGVTCDIPSDEYDVWRGLLRRLLAESWHYASSADFCLTRAGALAALEPGETLDREDFPK